MKFVNKTRNDDKSCLHKRLRSWNLPKLCGKFLSVECKLGSKVVWNDNTIIWKWLNKPYKRRIFSWCNLSVGIEDNADSKLHWWKKSRKISTRKLFMNYQWGNQCWCIVVIVLIFQLPKFSLMRSDKQSIPSFPFDILILLCLHSLHKIGNSKVFSWKRISCWKQV